MEPGISDVFARYAADHLFGRIDEIGVRDGADLLADHGSPHALDERDPANPLRSGG